MGAYPEFTKLTSSNVDSCSYQAETGTLHINFVGGGRYTYSSVPQDIYEGLIQDPSPGSYFSQNIKGVYPYARY